MGFVTDRHGILPNVYSEQAFRAAALIVLRKWSGTALASTVPEQDTHHCFLLSFVGVLFLFFFPDSPDTSLTSRDLHVGQMDTFPVLS
jgi:hypothetical protein